MSFARAAVLATALAAYLTDWTRKPGGGDAATLGDRGLVFDIDANGRVALIHAGSPSIQHVEGCL